MIKEQTFTFTNDTHHKVHVYYWSRFQHTDGLGGGIAADADWTPEQDDLKRDEDNPPIRGIVQIAHGMAETAKRYARLAETLVRSGYAVYANDHRGHGLTAGSSQELGWPGEDGFNGMVRDMAELGRIIRSKHPGLPLYLLGHSMGSFLAQKMMYFNPMLYTGFILTGTNGPRPLLSFGARLAHLQSTLQGAEHPSLLMNALTFGGFNKKFLPIRTPFDWLSRDEQEVDRYIEDPHCGFLCSAGFFVGFFSLLREIHKRANMRKIPIDKPVYIFGGGEDPVGMNGKGVRRLVSIYEELGLLDVEFKLYPGGRHEMLNETNREEVMKDLANWLNRHT